MVKLRIEFEFQFHIVKGNAVQSAESSGIEKCSDMSRVEL